MIVTLRMLVLGAGTLLASTTLAAAGPAVLLTGERTLVTVDTETWEVRGTVDVEGVDRLHGIDFRAADNELYGVDARNRVLRIDPQSGTVVAVSTLGTPVPAGASVAVDFNPVADRLRIVSGTANLRVNIENGEVTADGNLAYASGDANSGAAPDIAAVAYTNSLGTPEATAMFDIDATLGSLIRQAPPNDGTLETIGGLGIEGTAPYAFDIHSTEAGENAAWLVTNGQVYTVNLESGAATQVGPLSGIEGAVRDISVMPGAEM